MKASGGLWEVKYRTHHAKWSHEGQGPGIEEIALLRECLTKAHLVIVHAHFQTIHSFMT